MRVESRVSRQLSRIDTQCGMCSLTDRLVEGYLELFSRLKPHLLIWTRFVPLQSITSRYFLVITGHSAHLVLVNEGNSPHYRGLICCLRIENSHSSANLGHGGRGSCTATE